MQTLDLQERRQSEPVRLAVGERDALKHALPSLTIEAVPGTSEQYRLTPGSTVGALVAGGLSVSIRPKIEVSRVLYLASHAMSAFKAREDDPFEFEPAESLLAPLAPAFVRAAERAFARGLLHGYRTEEDALYTVRGRIDFAEQIRRRPGRALPIEVRCDEFTDDIEANRLIKAAAMLLGRLPIDNVTVREGLRHIDATLANVSLARYRRHDIPTIAFDRLNGHYREVVELSRLILRHASLEAERGGVRASGFLIDMNVVFQEFVTRALREELGLSEHAFPSDRGLQRRMPSLDTNGTVTLKPDLSWWESGRCVFVGDAKYKRVRDGSVPNADPYQALAYATALDLPGALLASA